MTPRRCRYVLACPWRKAVSSRRASASGVKRHEGDTWVCWQVPQPAMAPAKTRGTLADADGNSGFTFALAPTVGSTRSMLEMLILPNVRTFSTGVAVLANWRVSLAPAGAVYAMASSGTVT